MSDSKDTAINIFYNGIVELSDWIADSIKLPSILVRWIIIVLVLLFVTTILIFFETRLRFLYFSALERKVLILKELNQISNDGVTTKKDLAPVYDELVSELLAGKVTPMDFHTISSLFQPLILFFTLPMFWLKFLSGSALGMILILWTLVSRRGKKWSAFRGAFIVTIISGFLGVLMSLFYNNLWANAVILMVIQIIVLLGIGRRNLAARPPMQIA